jgi:hypothetical protein
MIVGPDGLTAKRKIWCMASYTEALQGFGDKNAQEALLRKSAPTADTLVLKPL